MRFIELPILFCDKKSQWKVVTFWYVCYFTQAGPPFFSVGIIFENMSQVALYKNHTFHDWTEKQK